MLVSNDHDQAQKLIFSGGNHAWPCLLQSVFTEVCRIMLEGLIDSFAYVDRTMSGEFQS